MVLVVTLTPGNALFFAVLTISDSVFLEGYYAKLMGKRPPNTD